MNYSIRKIEKKDDVAIAAIIRQCLIEYGGDHRPDTAWADPYLDHFSDVYVNHNNCYWVAENDVGVVVAGVGIGPLTGSDDICELQKMYCLPEYRGTGIAQALMDKALSFAKTLYTGCYLETLQNMDRAKRFYEKNGFSHTTDTIGNTGHSGCDYHYVLFF